MKIYLANTTISHVSIHYPAPDVAWRMKTVPNMDQIVLHEGTSLDIDKIVERMTLYGIPPVDRVTAPYVGCCYSINAPVDLDALAGIAPAPAKGKATEA